MATAARSVPDGYYDRFENSDAARQVHQKEAKREAHRKQENLELYGTAAKLFTGRFLDTFEVEHGRLPEPIEFYRPVGDEDIDFSALAEDDRELADRVSEGGKLIKEYRQRQQETIKAAGAGEDLTTLLDQSMENIDLLCRVLSAFAVDDSLRDPRVWRAFFQDEGYIAELFEDFFTEGQTEDNRQRLRELQNLISEQSSQDSVDSTG